MTIKILRVLTPKKGQKMQTCLNFLIDLFDNEFFGGFTPKNRKKSQNVHENCKVVSNFFMIKLPKIDNRKNCINRLFQKSIIIKKL